MRTLLPATCRGLAAGFGLLLGLASAMPAEAATPGRMRASYTIAVAGITVGGVEAESRFTANGYAMSLRGFTSGVSRLVSDATTLMASNGRLGRDRPLPATYTLDTTEDGADARVRMQMRSGDITALDADPGLIEAADRVPVTAADRRAIVDPLSAFIVPVSEGEASGAVCNRTVPIFDGWQRYDIRLTFKEVRAVTGDEDGYTGDVTVCRARYVPVAGHRPSREAVQYMANNANLEVWLMPVGDGSVMVPYNIVIGTRLGIMTIRATRFIDETAQHAAR
jgi:hypothetical protein